MEEIIAKIRAVISTLEVLDIRSTYDNMNRLLGCMQTLTDVCDQLKEVPDGNADTE